MQIQNLLHDVETLKTQSAEQYAAILSKLEEVKYFRSRKIIQEDYPGNLNYNNHFESDIYTDKSGDYYHNVSNQNLPSYSQTSPASNNLFIAPERHLYPPLIYHSSSNLHNYYQSGISLTDPNIQSISSVCSSNICTMPPSHPQMTTRQNIVPMSQISENLVQPQNFQNLTLSNQMLPVTSVQNSSIPSSIQTFEPLKTR